MPNIDAESSSHPWAAPLFPHQPSWASGWHFGVHFGSRSNGCPPQRVVAPSQQYQVNLVTRCQTRSQRHRKDSGSNQISGHRRNIKQNSQSGWHYVHGSDRRERCRTLLSHPRVSTTATVAIQWAGDHQNDTNQASLSAPALEIDETDSGLDIDALRTVAA